MAGVSGIPVEVAQRTYDKAEVRHTLTMAALDGYQPDYVTLYPEEWREMPDLRRFCAASGQWHAPYPLVIKPTQQRASRGLTIVHHQKDEASAVRKAFEYSAPILIEQGLTGTEHSVEAIFGEHHEMLWFNIVDRMFTYDHGLAIETGHVNPTALSHGQQGTIRTMLREAAEALDIHWGPFKIDAMWTADGPKILECTARLSGGWDSQGTSPLRGRHPLRTLLHVACGLPVEPILMQAQGYAACAAILPQVTGIVSAVPQWNTLTPMMKAMVSDIIWAIKPGDRIAPAEHNGARAGFVITYTQTYADAWQRALAAAEALAAAIEIE